MERLLSVASAVLALVLLTSWALGVYPPRHRIHDVQIGNFAFTPDDLTITAGDSVRWIVSAGTHSATSGAGTWDSPDLVAGRIFEQQFNQSGEYSYHCRIHSFMHARVRVVPVSALRALSFWGVAALGACAVTALILRQRQARNG